MNDTQLAMLGVLTALNKMMRGQYFDITVIDSAVKALRAQPDGRAYEILRTVHCVHWTDMPAELRDKVPALIERCISVPAYQFTKTDQPHHETLSRLVVDATSLTERTKQP